MLSKILLKFFLLPGVLLITTGCAITDRTRQAGLYEHSLVPRSFGFSEEGHVVIEAELLTDAAYTLLTDGRPRRPPSTRFVIAEPEVVRTTIEAARERPENQPPQRAGEDQPLQLFIVPVGPEQEGWQMIPYDNDRRGADDSMLPELYREIDSTAFNMRRRDQRQGIWREETDEAVLITFDGMLPPRDLREQTMWWHYPTLALLPATVVADLLTFPLQVGIYVWQANMDWR